MAVIYSSDYVKGRLLVLSDQLICEVSSLYARGKRADRQEAKLAEIGFALTFLPYWSTDMLKKTDCYFNGGIAS